MSAGGTELDRDELEKLIDAFPQVHLLVMGDVVLDEYLYGEVDRVSPEAPVPVVHVSRESVLLGGAGNVVRNIVALGGRCSFCSVVGDDADGDRVLELIEQLAVSTEAVVRAAGRPTTRKTRVVARSQQIVRFDRETRRPFADATCEEVFAALEGLAQAGAGRSSERPLAGAVLEDYGKGLFTPSTIRRTMAILTQAGLPVSVDPKGELASYRGAALVKPNLREAQALTGIVVKNPDDMARLVRALRREVGDADVVVTCGGEGMSVFEGSQPGVDVGTARQQVYDVQGAGDTAIAALALAQRAGASLVQAAVIANAAAGAVVQKIGTATASPDEVRAILPAAIGAAGVHSPRHSAEEHR